MAKTCRLPPNEKRERLVAETTRFLNELRGLSQEERKNGALLKQGEKITSPDYAEVGKKLHRMLSQERLRLAGERRRRIRAILLGLVPAVWQFLAAIEGGHPRASQFKERFSELLENSPPQDSQNTSKFLWSLHELLRAVPNLIGENRPDKLGLQNHDTSLVPLGDRNTRLQAFVRKSATTMVEVLRAANVHKTDGKRWLTGDLSDRSEISKRIEKVLAGCQNLKAN
jgi:hypothetical protein